MPAAASDWAQVAGNPQHTAFMPAETLGTSWSVAWRYQLGVQAREKLYGQAQAIVSAGHVLVPSLMGKLRSFAAGQVGPVLEWTADVGAPIMGSAAADGVRAYVADIYGRLTAYTLSNGQRAWGPVQVTPGLPIQTSPLLADGKLLIGGTDGTFYARDPATGAAIWSRSVGAPILQTAAWSNVTGTGIVVFGAMDMRLYGLDSATGNVLWQTPQLTGSAFKDYWPVIDEARRMVIVRPWAKLPYWESGSPQGLNLPLRGLEVANYLDDASQSAMLAAYDAYPTAFAKTLYVVNLSTGAELPPPIHWQVAITMHGASPPPCIDRDGYLVIPAMRPSTMSNSWMAGWARVNLSTRKVVDGLIDGATERGFGNRDENMCVSACSNGIVAMHIQQANAQYTGFYRQTDKTWTRITGGAGTSQLFVNTQGSGANPAAISGGLVYHLAHPHTLVCLKAA
ncbi:MAG: PQQ-binding-like beta-propeller repeat protein [Chloroflexota bacterium]